jgi:hypothetical protein
VGCRVKKLQKIGIEQCFVFCAEHQGISWGVREWREKK